MKKLAAVIALSFAVSTTWASNRDDLNNAAVKAHTNYEMANLSMDLTICGWTNTCGKKADEKLAKFKETFGAASADPKVRAAFAQWMTAMSTSGTRQGAAENAKFETLKNDLMVD